MNITRIKIDCNLPDAVRALASPQVMHAIVAKCFDSSERKLWRIDNNNLLIVSTNPPSDIAAAQQLSGDAPETKEYDSFLTSIKVGQTYRFRLTANAVHSGPSENGKRGKIIAYSDPVEQLEWIQSKSEKSGFTLNECFVAKDELLSFRRGNDNIVLRIVTYDGVLTVTDENLLTEALTFGIGRAKAYGAGLITLMP